MLNRTNNAFQVAGNDDYAHEKALHEFNEFVEFFGKTILDVTVWMIRRILLHRVYFPLTGYHFMMMEHLPIPDCMLVREGGTKTRGYWKSIEKIKSKTKLIQLLMSRRIFPGGTGSMVLDREIRCLCMCFSTYG